MVARLPGALQLLCGRAEDAGASRRLVGNEPWVSVGVVAVPLWRKGVVTP